MRQVRDLRFLAVLGVEAGDTAVLPEPPPRAFLEHLHQAGLPVPRILGEADLLPDAVPAPFGWNEDALSWNRRQPHPADPPPLEIVRRVNARSHAAALERELDPEGAAGTVCATPDAAFRALAEIPGPAVLKAEHGNAGLANFRVTPDTPPEAVRRFVADTFREDNRLVVEPWRRRVRDWCSVFSVPWREEAFHGHEMVNTADGALVGVLVGPGMHPPGAVRETARAVAAHLEAVGYFGPVCLDSFTWDDGRRIRVRPLVDLNCRQPLSDPVLRWWRRHLADRFVYFRLFRRDRLRLPDDPAAAHRILGPDAFRDGMGVLVLSPGGAGAFAATRRLAVAFTGRRRPDVEGMERRFRERFET